MMTTAEKLTALRRAMARRGLAAYLVLTDDFHASEYVGDYFKAREYLSGFTGSAGRKRGGSTGMGLYIVSKLCEALNISLEIASEEGRYTRFSFRFPN